MRYNQHLDTIGRKVDVLALTFELTFEQIDEEMRSLDMAGLSMQSARAGGRDSVLRLVLIYRAMRPILTVIASLPLLLPGWRAVIQMFVATLDGIAVTTDPAFKAGKDL